MFRELVDKHHTCFYERIPDWKDAIVKGCEPLIRDGSVDEPYAQEIIACVEKYGPYIVICPHIAMPHSTESGESVHKTSVSFMKVEEPVIFDENDRSKDVNVFFTISSNDHEQHLRNIADLVSILNNDDLIGDLLKVKNNEDLLKLADQYE